MKKTALLFIGAATLFAASCKKTDNNNNNNTTVTESAVINDFVGKIVLPMYQTLQDKATVLNSAVNTLNTAPTAANLEAARTAWRDTRSVWEQCEGFLVGPVEDDNYDPNMDTWPVDYNQLDSFINTSSSFTVTTIQDLSQGLRGFHPLEYILWGRGGAHTVDSISARQKQYMVGLSQDILNNITQLNASWSTSGGNFQTKVLTAGSGSTLYPTRKEAFVALVAGMSGICSEVGGGKMLEPFTQADSNLTESPFSHNSITDFTNNITGARNVYLCSFNGQTGASISNMVAAKNISLDNKIKEQYASAIAALGNVTTSFEMALYTQRTQLQVAMNAINTLQGTLDGELKTFMQTYIKD